MMSYPGRCYHPTYMKATHLVTLYVLDQHQWQREVVGMYNGDSQCLMIGTVEGNISI